MLTPWKESDDQPRQHIQKQRYYFANKKVCLVKAMVFRHCYFPHFADEENEAHRCSVADPKSLGSLG